MKFHPALAPIKAAVLPLSKKLAEPARRIHADLRKHFNTFYDDAGQHRQPLSPSGRSGNALLCRPMTSTPETDGCVTIRDRDTMNQERIPTEGLVRYLRDRLEEAL